MIIPLVKSKFAIPELSEKALLCERIRNLGIAENQATIITAPAGFGKTTSVLLSLKQHRTSIHWYRMEEEDSFLPLFYTHLIETLFPDTERASLDSARALSSLDNVPEEYLLQNALICQDAWSAYSEADHPRYLVFDDFQNVLDNPLIAKSVRYFIVNMPASVRIIVMSRTETGIMTGKMALDRHCAQVHEDDLRFTKEEIKTLFMDKYGLSLTSSQLDTVFSHSEGWIAGLAMICHMDNPAILETDLFSPQPVSHTQTEQFSLYFNEFLAAVDSETLLNLAKMSLLSDFSCDELQAILHIQNAQKILEWLESSNVYIQKLSTVPIRYRFHSLFRRELETCLQKLVGKNGLLRLQLTAAQYFEKQGEILQAIHFYMASRHLDEAKALAAQEGVRIFHSATPEKVIPILMEFPEHCIQADPHLLFFRGISLMSMQQGESFQCFLGALLLFRKRGDVKLMMDALGMTIPMSFVKNNYTYIRNSIRLIPKLRVILSNKNGRKKLLLTAFMSLAWSDRLILGGFFCRVLERMDPVEPVWEYCFYLVKGVILYRRGLLDDALRNSWVIMNHEALLFSDQWKSIGLSCSHNAPLLMAQVEGSEKYLTQFAELAEKYDSAFAHGYALRLAAYIKHQSMDFSGMLELMHDAAEAFLRDGNPTMACVVTMTRYLWEAEQNEPALYAEMAEKELEKLKSLNPGQGFMELCQTITGALYKECGNYEKAERLLKLAYKTSRRKKATQSMCGTLLHLADMHYRRGDLRREKRTLALFSRTMAKHNYVYLREMNYSSLVRVCARCILYGFYPQKNLEIITRYFGGENAQLLNSDPAVVASDPAAFINSYIKPRQKPRKIRVEFFGAFRLMSDTALLGEKDWKTRKSSGIVKYLLASNGETVSRETLAATFWPDSDTKAANTSLRAALYEIRRTLARSDLAFGSENAILTEDKQGFKLAEGIILETDTEEFCNLYEQYQAGNDTQESAKSILIEMTRIYKGDYLAGDTYDEWVLFKRDQYRSMFAEALHALASRYLTDAEHKAAEELLLQLLKINSLDEAACGSLIRLYETTGQTTRATTLKRQFTLRFEDEMGAKPVFDTSE